MDKIETTNKLAINVANSWKMLSVQWMAFVSTVAGIWLAIPKEMQDSILSHLPVPPWALAPISFVIGYLVRVKPQFNMSAAVAEAKSVDAPQDPVPVPAIVAQAAEVISPQGTTQGEEK